MYAALPSIFVALKCGLFVIFSKGTTLQSTSFASSCFTPRPSTSFTANGTVNGNRRPQKISNLYSLIFNFRLFFFIIFLTY